MFLALAGFLSYKFGIWRIHYPALQEFPIQGLDVSHHQGHIRWNEISRKRFSFVYIKATEGGDFKDKKFSYNWKAAKAADFKVGAYHFFTLCRPGLDQAKNFTDIVPNDHQALPPVVDLEFVGNCKARPEKQKFLSELTDFTGKVESHYATKPIIYTTYEFFDRYLKDTSFAGYKIWIRDVFSYPSGRKIPDWNIWQYADNARVEGIDTLVDLNVMNK